MIHSSIVFIKQQNWQEHQHGWCYHAKRIKHSKAAQS
jgi:hypothetical protein